VSRAACDVSGAPGSGTRELNADERRTWRVATWITSACSDCRRGFRRRHGQAKATA
jgi:hypothetical protein